MSAQTTAGLARKLKIWDLLSLIFPPDISCEHGNVLLLLLKTRQIILQLVWIDKWKINYIRRPRAKERGKRTCKGLLKNESVFSTNKRATGLSTETFIRSMPKQPEVKHNWPGSRLPYHVGHLRIKACVKYKAVTFYLDPPPFFQHCPRQSVSS